MNILTLDTSSTRAGHPGSATPGLLEIGPEVDWQPDHLAPSAWLEHVPFAFWIMKALRPERCVELGTMRGVSYAALCQAVERLGLPTRCFAIDTWQGDDQAGHYDESVYTSLLGLNERHYRRFSTLIRSTFAHASKVFMDGEIDLLHIDGLHTYDAVSDDFATWRCKLSDRAVVLFHDTNVRRDDFGVWRFWQELSKQYPHFEFLHGFGLGVLGVGAHLPAPVQALFDAGLRADTKTAVRGLFAARGAAIQTRFDLQNARQEIDALNAHVAAQVAALHNEKQALLAAADQSREAAATARSEASDLRSQLTDALSQAQVFSSQAQAFLSEVQTLQQRLASATAEIAGLRTLLGRHRSDIQATLTREIAEVRAMVAAAVDDRNRRAAEERGLRDRLALAEARCEALLDSTSWRVSAPLRALSVLAGSRRALQTGSLDRQHSGLRDRMRALRRSSDPAEEPPGAAPARPAREYPPMSQAALLRPRLLIVAEMTLPQCRKYRVEQKQAMIRTLGWDCSVIAWNDVDGAISLMQTHNVVFFYRVPGFKEVLTVLDEADRLGLPHYWEVDDLIFDIRDYAANPNIAGLDAATAESLFDGALLYRKALAKCRNVIASTPYLAEQMQAVGGGTAFVIENALDNETLRIAETVRPREDDGKIRIIYGSGTRTHDADFALVAPALRRVAQENPNVEILLVGELNPPRSILSLGEQLVRMEARPYPEYMQLVADSDIAVAPLMSASFNEAKSNIKYLEAATVGVPSVCSPRSAFANAIRHGETGFLADTEPAWYKSLTMLVRDAALRRAVGAAARNEVLEKYSPKAIARRQLAPLLRQHWPQSDTRLHIMQVNILFRPQSFGGATIVAEEMTRRLHDAPDTRVSVVTSAPAGWLKPYAVERADDDGVPVFRIGIQDRAGWIGEPSAAQAAGAFHDVVRALRPDVVHFHAVQGLGAACLRICQEEGIPYVITLHDAWWVCERQFLVTGEGKYCGQHRVDMNVCATCVPSLGSTVLRNARLRQVLEGAALLLTPSEHWRRFYIANGFAADRIAVNENGIALPTQPSPNQGPERLRFGFVAGTEAVKGFPLLKKAFEALNRDDWELVLVNHGLSIGTDSFADVKWNVRGTIRTVPPFKPANRDAFYDGIDVLLFPSQWPESFGLTVREALARNKWVIATDRGGAAEAIRHGTNGTLIPIGEDLEPLRKAVEDLLDRKPDLRGWTNPSRDRLRDFAAQAIQLRTILASVALNAQVETSPILAAD